MMKRMRSRACEGFSRESLDLRYLSPIQLHRVTQMKAVLKPLIDVDQCQGLKLENYEGTCSEVR